MAVPRNAAVIGGVIVFWTATAVTGMFATTHPLVFIAMVLIALCWMRFCWWMFTDR